MNLKVADLCTELESELGVKFTHEVVASLGYLAYDKIQRSTEDFEAFAQHAKRTNVTADDVKLLTRRNSNLVNLILMIHMELTIIVTICSMPTLHPSRKRLWRQSLCLAAKM